MGADKQNKNDINKNMLRIVRVFIFLFVLLLANLSYLQVVKSDWLTSNSRNPRLLERMDSVQRGTITDCNGVKLAYSEKEGSSYKRVYPFGAVFAVPVGYVGKRIGNAGVERSENAKLSGANTLYHQLGPIEQLLENQQGDTVELTLNANLQKAAYAAMGNRRGAVVVMDTYTGAILAMVSKPSFNPNFINKQWNSLIKDKQSPLLNRAVQGLYPPGSTIKPLIAAAALEDGVITPQYTIDCKGYYDLGDGHKIKEAHGEVHGHVDLRQGIEKSCNVMFAGLAIKLGDKRLEEAFRQFGFYDILHTDFPTEDPHMPDFKKLSRGETAQIGIGQANLLISPLRMVMLADVFGNQGRCMKPYIIKKVMTPQGQTIYEGRPFLFKTVLKPQWANLIEGYMKDVVLYGTGRRAQVAGVSIAGKTGTAENPFGADHAWFIGTATFKNGRSISFAVILENSGYGGAEAAPVIKDVIKAMLRENNNG